MDLPIPLIPKEVVKPDADITALVNEDGYILNAVHALEFAPIVQAKDVVGKHLSELYKPVPNEILRCLERAFEGEAHWAAITLPTITPVGLIDRRFVVAFEPWESIGDKAAALIRMKLISDDLTEALEHSGTSRNKLRQRANHLISSEFSLNGVYVDALIDLTMRQSGFDATMMLDEDGVVLDVFSLVKAPNPIVPGSNFIEFMETFDTDFRARWNFALDHWQYINAIEEIPMSQGQTAKVLVRLRVTTVRTPAGKRIVQVFVRTLDRS